jgi:hypothetical protein
MSSPFPKLTLTLYPPVPDPRAAHGLSSHPPLRSAGERREGRQPRARPRAARRRSASARACRAGSGHARYAVPVLRIGHAHHRGVQGRSKPAPQADRDASRHQDRHVVNSRSTLRRRIIERPRRFRAGHGQARPSLYPAEPATFKSASSSRCRASQATSPTPRRLTIAPPATSAAPTSAAPKFP